MEPVLDPLTSMVVSVLGWVSWSEAVRESESVQLDFLRTDDTLTVNLICRMRMKDVPVIVTVVPA